ncbi:MAG: hypothetical protein GDA68_12460 [Nitrospira sp. CR2.1]|nr:hypothetical protein [Nitrospira sp. CR2.1]
MAIPDFQTLMLPVLRQLAAGGEQAPSTVRAAVAALFKLSKEELAALLPSGRQTIFSNRVAWVRLSQTSRLSRESETRLVSYHPTWHRDFARASRTYRHHNPEHKSLRPPSRARILPRGVAPCRQQPL